MPSTWYYYFSRGAYILLTHRGSDLRGYADTWPPRPLTVRPAASASALSLQMPGGPHAGARRVHGGSGGPTAEAEAIEVWR